jgi:glycosyltransferase involved in cell wall biosynthesis
MDAMGPLMRITPKVSVIIPTRNRADLLVQTLASVRAQSYENFEAIVIDDHSSDDTPARLADLARLDPRIIPLRNTTPRRGANVGRNMGIARAQGQFIVFLDSDDLLAPDCLKHRVETLLKHPELDFAVWNTRCFREQPNDTPYLWNVLRSDEPDLNRFLILDGPWQTTSVMWTRRAIERLGRWDEDLLSLQDWDWHVRALLAGLRYEKFDAIDNYYRLPFERHSITDAQTNPAHYRSHAKIAGKIVRMAQASGRLDAVGRLRLMAVCRFFAERCAKHRLYNDACRLWRVCHRSGLIDLRHYVEGLIFLRIWNTHRPRTFVLRHFVRRWPFDQNVMFRNTLYQTPLPDAASAAAAAG